MARRIGTTELRRVLAEDGGRVQLLEVLPRGQYDEEHLEGARCLPLGEIDADAVAALEADAPVVVYGFDAECDLAPRAAARLEALGCGDVAVYGPGKAGWLADGLPSGGSRRPEQRVSAVADPDVPLVPGTATLAEAATIVGDADVGIVVDGQRVVLGLLRPETFGLDPSTPVADVLQPGPSTFRPSMTIGELVEYFRTSDESRAIVSTHTGEWIGLIRRGDVLDG